MRPWKKHEARASTGARWLALFGFLFLVGLSLATIADVFGRWLFNNPLHGVSGLDGTLPASFKRSLTSDRGPVEI